MDMAEVEPERHEISPQMRRSIEATSDCYMVCSETLRFSLDGRAELSLPSHIRLLVDCGEILQATQDAMLRGSELSLMLTAICMEACEKLALSCRSMNGVDPQLAACAEACEETAEACRALSV
jgi:hypothetical protein